MTRVVVDAGVVVKWLFPARKDEADADELARSLNHHVFDTLYHAVALALPDTVLVTADIRYERKARWRGAIMLLRDIALA